jgi:glycosyltransferase involved in cell wall biosynthesis
LAEQFDGARVVREERKGVTKARQNGFMKAKGAVLADIDADTRMPKEWYDPLELAKSVQGEL